MKAQRRLSLWHTAAAVAVALCLVPFAMAQHYLQTNLASDVPGLAAHTDPHLVNGWGLTRSATSPWWISDNGTGLSTLYNASGTPQALVVTVPPPDGSPAGTLSTPTGTVFNGTTGFVVTGPNGSGAARFIFATEDGTISGWNPAANPTHAILEVRNQATSIYKGLAITTFNGATNLYAANFRAGRVDVFDSTWAAATLPGTFTDPNLPAGYAPFNVQAIGADIFVSFAKQGTMPDEIDGRGLGYVDQFTSGGVLVRRFQHGPWMNAPWGMALSPANFGEFSNMLLVGQFGSGQIAAFDPVTGEFQGLLHGKRGALVIDGLWALIFGGGAGTNGATNGATNTLFFTAGLDGEQHGLFGTLTAAPDNDGNDNDANDDNGADVHNNDQHDGHDDHGSH